MLIYFAIIRLKGCANMNSRLKLLRKELNMSQELFGSKLGVTGAGISKIESGQRNLTDQMILLICKEFGVNEDWLRNGSGKMYLTNTTDCLDELVQKYDLDELDKKIIHEYAKLDIKRRSAIKDYIVKLAYNFLNESDLEKHDHDLYKTSTHEHKSDFNRHKRAE